MNKKFIKSFAALLLVLCMMLTNFGGWNHVLAEETSEESPIEQNLDEANPSENENKETNEDKEKPQEDNHEEGKIEEDNKEEADKTVEENTDETENDGLEISDEVKPEAVGAGIPAPTITKAFIGTNTISGGNVHVDRVNKKVVRGTVHVTLKDKDGAVKADDLTFTPKSGKNWTVDLPAGVTVAEGDTVTAYQEFDGQNSPATTANAMESLAKQNKDKLKMPEGEIWIEQTSSNQVNDDEQAEAVQMFNAVNAEIAGDIKSVKFSIDSTDHAYYEVTYTDGSTSGKVEATNLKIKQVTEHSRGATLGSITIVDNVIKGQLSGEGPFDGIKVQILLKLSDAVKDSYCDGGKCLTDKDTSDPVDATVNGETGEFTYTITNPDLKLDQKVGVTVKEPHKFKSCSKTTVIAPTPKKTDVRDPRKLTEDDKTAIINTIKEAYKVNGEDKLPNGTGAWNGIPAFIEFDKDGNARIISPNNVNGSWSNGTFVPKTKADGSLDVKNESNVTVIPAKDLVKNIKPEAPAVKLSDDKKNITITPKEVDTDATIIAVSYKDKDGNDQTTTATKADDGTWSIVGEGTVVDGVVTIPKNKVKSGTDVTATVTDKGGVADDDTTPLTSDPGTYTVKETIADKVEALGGLDPVALKKWVGDEVDWKDGVKAKDSAKETEVNKLLEGATFTDATETKRTTEKAGDVAGKVKVKFDDGSELVVDKQMLYVSDLVSPSNKENLPDDALDVQLKLGEGVKVEDKDPNTGAVTNTTKGDKDNPVLYKEYKVKPGTDFSTYEHPTLKKTIFDLIDEEADEGYTEPVWSGQDTNNPKNFVVSDTNKVFTATATKTYDITFDANSGSGTKEKVTQKVNTEYELPAANTFTAPENKQFSGWQVGKETELKQPGAKIKITGDTVVKAIWKPIEVKVKFQTEAGAKGTMEEKTVNKGSKYELPTPTFTPDEGKEFAGWKVGDQEGVKQAKEEITITGDVTLTATWKDIEYKVTVQANGGTGDDKVETKKLGEKYTLPKGDTFTPPENKEFAGWLVGDTTTTTEPGTEITITGDTVIKASWKPIMVDVSFDKGEGSGNKDKVSVAKGSEYTLPNSDGFTPPANQEFAGWQVGNETKKVGDKITVNENTTVTAKYKPIMVDVSFDKGEGSGSKDKVTIAKGSEYTLPNSDGFTPPENQEFAGWEVNGETKNVGDKITVNENTTVTAKYKPIMVEVSFDKGEGSGSKDKVTIAKGSEYTLPNSEGFTAPKNKEFAGWEVNGETKNVGDKITVNENTTVTAKWKDIEYKVSFNGNTGTGSMDAATVKKGEKYKLPENKFKAPSDKQEFKTWEVDGKEVAPGTEITIDKDTVVKAIWKDIMVDITFDKGEGSGNKDKVSVAKGSKYTLPNGEGFTPPTNQEFAGWKVGNDSEVKAVGTEINIDGDIKLTAVYKNKSVEPDKPGKPDTPDNPKHPYYPDYPSNPSKPSKPDTKPEPKPGTEKPSQPGPGEVELPVTPKPDGTKEVTPDPKETDKVEVTVTPEGGKPTKVEVKKDKDGNWITDKPDIVKVDPKTGKITIVKGAKDVRAIASLKLERGTHHKYLYGYPDGTVRPEGLITRAEAAALIARLAKLDMSDASKPNFKDVPSRWYNSAINAVVKKNLIFANKDGKFRPNEAITRGEFARALFYIDKVNDAVAPFADVKGHEFEKAINQAYGNDRISGYPDGTFKPNAFIKRAEAAKILNHYANRGVDHDGILGQKKYIAYFTDLNETYWGYYEIMEAANSHEYERPLNTRIETWTKILNK